MPSLATLSALKAGVIRGRVRRMDKKVIYHLCHQSAWREAAAQGVYEGSDLDRRDGFIHCSTAEQVPDTVARYFPGTDVLLLTVDPTQVDGEVKWEETPRGTFPHLYGRLPLTAVTGVEELAWTGEDHRIPFLKDE